MEVRCDKCQARYRVDDARIGPQGLTMRCGKCQNVFRVSRAGQEAKPAAVTPTGTPPAPKPAAPAANAPADEGAGRTMMFQTGNIKSTTQQKKPEPDAGATMVFGQSPLAKPPAPAPKAAPAPKPAENGAGATMVFGQSPLARQPAPPSPAKPVARSPEPEPQAAAPVPAPPAVPEPAPRQEPAAEEEMPRAAMQGRSGVEAEGAEEQVEAEPPRRQGTFDKAPPKGLFIAVAVILAIVILGGGALFAVKKFGRHPPPPAAVETLGSAQAEADKDSLASLAAAAAKARDALDAAGPRSDFPQATATLARIEVQWADALADQAALVDAKGGEGAETRSGALQNQAKAHLRSAFEVLAPAIKADPRSGELQVALADYYRAQRSGSNMNKALKAAQAHGASEDAVALVQGMALAQEEDGAQKAVPRLKAALAANPQSARVHFRLALAWLAQQDAANAAAELKETLKVSPQHERAKAAMEQLATASTNGK